ncbi:AraC family transcriptional regulator [Shinella curvata]|uniref:AraC family transcriptional regulator n=1 Tax=Shinella curvata TaxID=1817964 RepID=A0ABT8XLC8_9HYPH|nr:AraC family transcriptional regulator [Shinella curvata]MCJ8056632.1 AraC family transcriptional regulator [Shinella curvata]MDO6124528.1 AraC family transcriptional regulator [Shinella curvata]
MSEIFSVFNADQAYTTAPHDHEEFMVLMPKRGVMRFTDEENGRSATIAEHQFLFVPPGWGHSTAALSNRQRHFAFYVEPDYMRHALRDICGRSASGTGVPAMGSWQAGPALRHLLCARGAFETANNAAHQQARREGADRLLLLECMITACVEPALHRASPEQHGAALVRNVCTHLAENLDQPVSLDDLAAIFNLSRRHLTRLFCEHTGETVLAHLQRLRMRRAQELLRHTRLSVLQVAGAVGFQSPSHFSALFAREAGMNPDQWRRQARANA